MSDTDKGEDGVYDEDAFMRPMFGTVEVGKCKNGDTVTLTRAGDTERFIVKAGDDWVTTVDYGDARSEEEARKQAVLAAENHIRDSYN